MQFFGVAKLDLGCKVSSQYFFKMLSIQDTCTPAHSNLRLLKHSFHNMDETKAAMILRLLGNETIHFNTRVKKSEPAFRKQLKIDVKSTTKLNFFFKYINVFKYFTNRKCFRFSFLYFKHLPTLIVCVTMFFF